MMVTVKKFCILKILNYKTIKNILYTVTSIYSCFCLGSGAAVYVVVVFWLKCRLAIYSCRMILPFRKRLPTPADRE